MERDASALTGYKSHVCCRRQHGTVPTGPALTDLFRTDRLLAGFTFQSIFCEFNFGAYQPVRDREGKRGH